MNDKLRKLIAQLLTKYYLLQLKKDQWKDPRLLKKIQFKKLKAIIKHAYNYVPYYHRMLSSAKIKPENIRNRDDLRRIPLTTKQDIQKNYLDIFSKDVDVSKLPSSFTSGSTGIPLKVIFDYPTNSYFCASTRYSLSECGVKPSDKFVTVWGRAQSIVWSKKYARLLGNICETVVPIFPQELLINILRQIKPDVINTFPTILSSLANYDISGINPELIFTQGEVVTQHCRSLVKTMFDLELLETYGSVEFGLLAFECNEHCGLHMITNGTYIEFVDEQGEYVSLGEQGEIIITGLYNRTMPFIRYKIGDIGIPSNERCSCGRSWSLIKNIQGRINDFLILPSGRKITWLHFYHHFYKELEKNVLSVSQYQIIQDRKDRIVFRIVKGSEFDPKILERIKNNLEAYFAKLGEKLEVVMQVVKEIPAERTGKRRILISKLN